MNKMDTYDVEGASHFWYNDSSNGVNIFAVDNGNIVRMPVTELHNSYTGEATLLWRTFACAVTTADHAARVIQRVWRKAITCPKHALCIKRLQTEWDELALPR